MTEILSSDDATGTAFTATGGNSTILVDTHAGGVWTLQVESPGGVWIDSDISFTGTGIQDLTTVAGLSYRLNGGMTGARAFAAPVR